MERGIIEFFKLSVEQILDDMADIGIKKVELIPYKNTSKFETGLVTIFTIYGDKQGEIIFAYHNEVIDKLVAKLHSDDFDKNENEEVYSATIIELCNTILGKALTYLLEENGLEINISSPIMIASESMEIKTLKKESIHLLFDSSIGDFSLFISMVEPNCKGDDF